jgi:hypothetical protein
VLGFYNNKKIPVVVTAGVCVAAPPAGGLVAVPPPAVCVEDEIGGVAVRVIEVALAAKRT